MSGPPGPANKQGTAAIDGPFSDRDWTNGAVGGKYQQNAVGPWQRPDRECVAPWPARGAGEQNYFLRPSALRAEATWPVGYPPYPQTRPTAFHVRQTKLIDHPCAAMVIQTDGDQLQNYGSCEWLLKADNGPTGALAADTPAASYLRYGYPNQQAELTALAIPSFRNSQCTAMHILVNLPRAGRPRPVAGHAYPPSVNVNDRVERDNYHLRKCWYAALDEGMFPSQPPLNVVGYANAAIPGNAAAAPYRIPAARTIAFPLMGYRDYGFERAAMQACEALRNWFSPIAGSESITVAQLTAAGMGTRQALRRLRRLAYDDVYLTVPNGFGRFNPAPAQGEEVKNVFKENMGGQEVAWHRAFFDLIRCPTCGTDEIP